MAVKRAGLAAAFVLLCLLSESRYGSSYPNYWICQAYPHLYAGQEVTTGFERVTGVVAGGYEIREEGFPLIVRTSREVPAGTYARARGLMQADGTLLATDVVVDPNYRIKRNAQWVVSVAGLALFGWFFLRHVRIRTRTFSRKP